MRRCYSSCTICLIFTAARTWLVVPRLMNTLPSKGRRALRAVMHWIVVSRHASATWTLSPARLATLYHARTPRKRSKNSVAEVDSNLLTTDLSLFDGDMVRHVPIGIGHPHRRCHFGAGDGMTSGAPAIGSIPGCLAIRTCSVARNRPYTAASTSANLCCEVSPAPHREMQC